MIETDTRDSDLGNFFWSDVEPATATTATATTTAAEATTAADTSATAANGLTSATATEATLAATTLATEASAAAAAKLCQYGHAGERVGQSDIKRPIGCVFDDDSRFGFVLGDEVDVDDALGHALAETLVELGAEEMLSVARREAEEQAP